MTDSNLIKIIDWENDNGVAYGMINDHIRNQFYDTIFKNSVEGKHCVDIGSGTGLLTMIALKYNPKHITAFEANSYRYQLLVDLVERLGLQDKVTVVNELFTKNSVTKEFDVIIHEILSDNIWSEGITHCLHPQLEVLPSVYSGEFFLYEITNEQAIEYSKQRSDTWINKYNSIKGTSWPDITSATDFNSLPHNIKQEIEQQFAWALQYKLDLGVTLDLNFSYELQRYLDNYWDRLSSNYPTVVYNQIPSKVDYAECITKSIKVFEYDFDTATDIITTRDYLNNVNTYSTNEKYTEMRIDKTMVANKSYLLLPKFSVKHKEHTLYLTESIWSLPIQLVLINNVVGDAVVRQYFDIDSGLRVYID